MVAFLSNMGYSSITATSCHARAGRRPRRAKAMDVVLFGADHADDGADPAASEPLAAIVAALEGSEEGKKQPLTRRFWLSHFGDRFEGHPVAHPLELLDCAHA
jgi:hypothetical protein